MEGLDHASSFGTNLSTNFSSGDDLVELFSNQDVDWIRAVKLLRNICIPLIAIIGLVGNTLSLLVFSTKAMRTSSCSAFLTALAVADNVFLVCLLVTWIDGEWFVLIRHDVTCRLLVFTTYVASFLSVWFIVGFSLVRFIALCFPLRNRYMCSLFREKVAVVSMTIAACLLYSFSIVATGMQPWGSHMHCSFNVEFFHFFEIATWIDSILTMVVPFVIIVIVNTMILYSLLNGAKRWIPAQRTSVNGTADRSGAKSPGQSLNPRFTSLRSRPKHKFLLTRSLLLVSTIFLLFNLPSHIIRLYNLIRSITHQNNQTVSFKFFFLQEVTLMLYNFTFSCNFVVYAIFGKNCMRSLREILRCRPERHLRRTPLIIRR